MSRSCRYRAERVRRLHCADHPPPGALSPTANILLPGVHCQHRSLGDHTGKSALRRKNAVVTKAKNPAGSTLAARRSELLRDTGSKFGAVVENTLPRHGLRKSIVSDMFETRIIAPRAY